MATGCTVLLSTQSSDAPRNSFLLSRDREAPEAVGTHEGPTWLTSLSEMSQKECEIETGDTSAAGAGAVTWHGKDTDSRDGQRELTALLPNKAETAKEIWKSNATATLCM